MNECKKYRASHEAIAPYFADSYNTLLSVVQGVALGALTYNFFTSEKISQLIIAKSIVSFGVICITWHRYVVHTQYIAWRLGFIDTLIPMLFAPLQFWLTWTIPKTIFDFSLAFLFTTILGLLA